ncbi:MAG: MucR family transcriptional regulator [Alphaproteobacteria bacterium]|nr:MucR family transcriptional regulator [Alphaproteobacteria bacterium]MBV9374419.1 MucR family transcriptional regulator [Alphaproteobacteria bacterium]
MNPQPVNPLLTAKIVESYLQHHTVGISELPDLITSVHRSLRELGTSSAPEAAPAPAVSVRQSVHPDYVVCLDCGYRGRTLRRHISSRHGLSREEYLRRWGLRPDHRLTAPAYSERRSTMAKDLGLGRKPIAGAAAKATPAEPSSATDDGTAEPDRPGPKKTAKPGANDRASQ